MRGADLAESLILTGPLLQTLSTSLSPRVALPEQPGKESVADILPHEEAVDGFLLPHHLDNLPVQVDKEGSPEATSNTGEKRRTRVEGRSSYGNLLPHTLLEVSYPMTAKAGSSWRSKGKSSRNRVLKRAVMVSEREK